jgi:membrane-associated protein
MINQFGYIGIGIICFLESGIFFLLPGDSLLFAAGLVGSKGVLNVGWLLLIVNVSSILGGQVGYLIGKYIDTIHKNKYLKSILSPKRIAIAHEYFTKYGNSTILLCRFVPIIRTFAPIAAGISGMSRKKFTLFNILGALIWSHLLILSGYFFGEMFPSLEENISLIAGAILVFTTAPVVYKLYKKYKSGKVKIPKSINE